MSGARAPMSARAEKATRLTVAGILSAPFGLTGLFTDTEWLGYVAVGIVLAAIMIGPAIERRRARG